MADAREVRCELCQREVAELTRHHLIPQTRHRNRRNKRDFDREDVRTRIALVCKPCHRNIHACHSNKALERRLNTLEALREDPEIQRFTRWIRKRPDGTTVTFNRTQDG